MIQVADLALSEGIYTFIDNRGTNINIASNRLHDWCRRVNPPLEIQLAPVTRELSRKFIRENCVSRDRTKELALRKELSPIIFDKDGTISPTNGGPNVYLVDGHHRYVLYSSYRRPWIGNYILDSIVDLGYIRARKSR